VVAALSPRVALGSKLSGRQSWRLLWASSKPLSVAVLAWAALDTFDGPLVVASPGFVVGAIPAAISGGLTSPAGDRLIAALVIAALLYAMSLVLDPVGGALGTAASQRITGQLQARLLTAVTAPVTVAHLEDQGTLDRLASAEGSLSGFFPGNAPVTWVGSVAGRLSGVFGCAVIAAYFWWLGLLLLVMWLAVRQVIVKSVLKQAVDMPSLDSEPLALSALDRAGAAELAGQLPSGLSTFVGGPYTGGQNLSGGQWQKLALGRAMRSPGPLLVVLDEPTASLDAHAEQALFDRYTEAAAAYAATAGTVTLLVSHRFATVRMADLIIYLEDGHATEAGTHDELLSRSGRYAELFTLQASGYR
jgi:hypothetical protein